MTYDEIAKMVNDKMRENELLSTNEVDDILNLPTGTSFEMSGWSDYFDWMEPESYYDKHIEMKNSIKYLVDFESEE